MYTHGHHDSVLRSHRWRTAENSAGYLLTHLRAGDSLLDVGCGPGTITADLARLVAPGTVAGVDVAADVLDEARRAVAGLDNVTIAVADTYHLDYPDDSFDVVHAHQVCQHLSDPVAALRELRRVAGRLVAVRDADYAGMAWYPQDERMDRWLALYRAVARANGGEPDAGRRLLSWARAAGYTDITATGSVWCYAEAEARAWWGGLWAERITSSALAKRAVELGLSDTAELAELGRAWHEWAAHEDAWFTVLHGEVLATA